MNGAVQSGNRAAKEILEPKPIEEASLSRRGGHSYNAGMKRFLGSCMTCACLLALGACATEAPKTSTNEPHKRSASMVELSAQTDSNRVMDARPR